MADKKPLKNDAGKLIDFQTGDTIDPTFYIHGLNSVGHTGIAGTEDNFMGVDATGLPKDSGSKASDFEPADADIQAHLIDTANPHSVTYAQAGAEPANANIQSHISSTANPHSVTYTQAGAEPANANIQSHISSTANPHTVTKTQVGLGNVANVDTTNASNLSSGTLDGARLPAPTATKAGAVPALAGKAGKFAQVNATEDAIEYNTPPGAGDMEKADYDTAGIASVRMARGIKESGGQELAMSTVADGEVLFRSGTNVDGIAKGNASGALPIRSGANAIDADEVKEVTATNGVLIDGVRMKDSFVELADISAPATPASGKGRIYCNSDQPMFISDSGMSHMLSTRLVDRKYCTLRSSYVNNTFADLEGIEFAIPSSALSAFYMYELFLYFGAESTSYGFTLSTLRSWGTTLPYRVMIPLTATTMYYNNGYADDTGTASATIPLQGIATMIGWYSAPISHTDTLKIRIKVENVLHGIGISPTSFCNLYKMI